jgi:hypothetical protein
VALHSLAVLVVLKSKKLFILNTKKLALDCYHRDEAKFIRKDFSFKYSHTPPKKLKHLKLNFVNIILAIVNIQYDIVSSIPLSLAK